MKKDKLLAVISDMIDEHHELGLTMHVPYYDKSYDHRTKESAKELAYKVAKIVGGIIEHTPQESSPNNVGCYRVSRSIDYIFYFEYKEDER